MTAERRGVLFGVAAYGMWGLFPLFWPLLEPAGAVEILSHRVVWSFGLLAVVALVLRRGPALRALVADRGSLLRLAVAAVFIAVNWAVYIWGVNHGHVVETSLGYFVNPIVTVLLGVVLLGEQLRRMQRAAVAAGALAVVVLSVDYGRPPWIALVLAFSFATYGFLKKRVGAGALETLTVETAILLVPASAYLGLLASDGRGTFSSSPGHAALLVCCGVVTAIPLLCFGAAATRVPLTTLGLLQYLTPMLQFLLGVFVRHEPMPPGRLAGFTLVWVALAILTADLVGAGRRRDAVSLPA